MNPQPFTPIHLPQFPPLSWIISVKPPDQEGLKLKTGQPAKFLGKTEKRAASLQKQNDRPGHLSPFSALNRCPYPCPIKPLGIYAKQRLSLLVGSIQNRLPGELPGQPGKARRQDPSNRGSSYIPLEPQTLTK